MNGTETTASAIAVDFKLYIYSSISTLLMFGILAYHRRVYFISLQLFIRQVQ